MYCLTLSIMALAVVRLLSRREWVRSARRAPSSRQSLGVRFSLKLHGNWSLTLGARCDQLVWLDVAPGQGVHVHERPRLVVLLELFDVHVSIERLLLKDRVLRVDLFAPRAAAEHLIWRVQQWLLVKLVSLCDGSPLFVAEDESVGRIRWLDMKLAVEPPFLGSDFKGASVNLSVMRQRRLALITAVCRGGE